MRDYRYYLCIKTYGGKGQQRTFHKGDIYKSASPPYYESGNWEEISKTETLIAIGRGGKLFEVCRKNEIKEVA